MAVIFPRLMTVPALCVSVADFFPQKVVHQAWSLLIFKNWLWSQPSLTLTMSSDVFCAHWTLDWCHGGSYSHLHRFLHIVSSDSNIQCVIENRHGEIYPLWSVPFPEPKKVGGLNPDYSEERVAAWIVPIGAFHFLVPMNSDSQSQKYLIPINTWLSL